MASISSDPDGRKRIQFIGIDGKRKSIRLGKASMKQAEAFKVKVAAIVTASMTGAMDDEVTRWLTERDEATYARLAAVGLVKPRQSVKLGAFLDGYVADRSDVKPTTVLVLGHTKRNLIEFFGADKPLREITAGDADTWRLNLIGKEKLSDNTVRRRCGIAKQFFRAACRRKLISENPFADLKAAVQGNASRSYFLSRDDSQKIVDACTDAQWRLIFALCRYGGLRCPSEHMELTWGDIDWDKGKMLVRSPKTEHHPDGESRYVPLFPELVPHLLEVMEGATPGVPHVIRRMANPAQIFRKHMLRIIKRAGLKPWPKLFHNLRSTRETELAQDWPEHIVCKWIGNSQIVARKHYFQMTDEDFKKAAHQKAQQPAAAVRIEQKTDSPKTQNRPVFPGDSEPYELVRKDLVGDKGLEPLTFRV
jgi:integrase